MRSASAKRNGLTEERIDEGIDNWRDSTAFDEREKLALEYSELMQFEPAKIDAAFYGRLGAHYTVAEIVELGTFIGFNVGYHTFFRTLDFYPMFTPDGRLVDQDESRRIYGATPVSHRDERVVRALHESQAQQSEEVSDAHSASE